MVTSATKTDREQRLKKLKDEVERKHGKTAEQLYQERENRVIAAMTLGMPDRVPFQASPGVFAAKYAGVPVSTMYYDHDAYREACLKMFMEYEPDLFQPTALTSGPALELLDARMQRWPGGTLPPDVPYQFVEGEYMKEDEYDIFLDDPSDFILRYYLPRVFGITSGVTKLSPLRNMTGSSFGGIASYVAQPEFMEMAQKLHKAGLEFEKVKKESATFEEQMAYLGFPARGTGGAITLAPFDTISDHLRGMRGGMIDTFRRPDKILAAVEKILEWRKKASVPASPKGRGKLRTQFMPLHRGSDEFMSIPHFEKFYWPTLKKAILHNIELGYICTIAWEGIWDKRLEYLLELPKGKVVGSLERTNPFRFKEVLGGHQCFVASIPPPMMQLGSVHEVEEYTKKLIQVCGKGGGFIMGTAGLDEAKPGNLRAVVDTVMKYGRY